MANSLDRYSCATHIPMQKKIQGEARMRVVQEPNNRPSCLQLLLELDMHREAEERGHPTLQYFLCDPYPPSTEVVADLRPISISDLRLETHHLGEILFVRTIDHGVRGAAVHNVVEDESGVADRLALYNSDPAANPKELLPKDALFAIKEPYYTGSINGGYSVRIDHPSDLVRLSNHVAWGLDGSNIPSADPSKSAMDWKEGGNIAYKAGELCTALCAYTHGIEMCNADDTTIKHDILRNRAIVNMKLQRFETALADARDAFIPGSGHRNDETIALNAKALYRAGSAAYKLGRFREAEDLFREMHESEPNDDDAFSALRHTYSRLQEQFTGEYDFPQMSRSASKKRNRLDHADFTSNTTISTGTHGRGLFATKGIEPGELILCEKAFCAAFDFEEASETCTILDHNTRRGLNGTQATLLFKLIKKLLHSPTQAMDFFDLFDGGYRPKTSLKVVEGRVPVDVFRTQAIVQYNCYGCPTARSSSREARKQAINLADYQAVGLWLRASYINHACNGNAMRSFMGDMMVVRATRSITTGEEITMPYRLPHSLNAVTQNELRKMWGFYCDCGICTAEAKPSPNIRHRSQLIRDASAFLSSHTLALQNNTNRRDIAQAEALFSRLRTTYDDRIFERNPRLGLVDLGLWLCEAYDRNGLHDKLDKAAIGLLGDLGYVVVLAGQKLDIDRRYCHCVSTAIEAALYAAKAHRIQGDAAIEKQTEEFARGLYWMMNGETREFDDKYGGLGVRSRNT